MLRIPNSRMTAESGVRQQVVGHVVLVGEGQELLLAVIADAVDADAGVLEEIQVVLQLDQLRSTVRSPHRRAIEHHNRLRVAPVRMVVNEPTLLVGQRERRQTLADLRPGGKLVRRWVATARMLHRDADW